MPSLPAALLAASLPALTAAAQKLPDPENPALTVELHALAPVLEAWEKSDYGHGLEIPAERLGLFARKFAQPAFAEGEDAQVLGERLLVARARPEQQAWIHRWLQRIVESPTAVVHLELRFATLPTKDFDQHVRPLLARAPAPDSDHAAPESAAEDHVAHASHVGVLTDEAHGKLLDKLLATGRCETLHAPSLLVNEFQRASMSTLEQRNYVKAYEPGPADTPVLTPVVDTLQVGVTLDAAASLLPDDAIGLRLVADQSELVEMAKQAWSPTRPDLKIQVPEVHRGRVDDWVRIPAEHCALWAVPDAEQGTVLLVTARTAKAR